MIWITFKIFFFIKKKKEEEEEEEEEEEGIIILIFGEKHILVLTFSVDFRFSP